ncbi:ephrin-A5-like isoform X2 [Daphnia pulex]|uniref:ephrin-A5-like isoform X2 n=1 Tax=Daphnia pulex TaxID=6669 RepID=UPI001EE08CC1|nr:ephrin-A5-like isoform X2 [Daphnia pulex]
MVRHHQRLASSSERIEDSSLITTAATTSTSSSMMWRRRYGCHCGSVRWPTWPPMLLLLLLVSVETLSLATVTTATRMHYIHWNTTNPIFRIDNTDHIIDVNKNNIPFEYDQVNIICPVYTPGTHEDDAEKYIIYNVSKEEYDTCRITNPNPRIIAVCDKPYKLMYFTITFRSFTPQPGGLEFRPGQDYYFISTSSRDDLHRRIGGRCSSHNMKVVFKVCCKAEDLDKGTTAGRPALPSTTTSTTMSTISTSVAVMNSTTTQAPVIPTRIITTQVMLPSVTSPRMPPHWKDVEIQSFSVRTTTKKSDDFDKLSNEVVKNEELTSKSSGARRQVVLSPLSTLIAAGLVTLVLFRVR